MVGMNRKERRAGRSKSRRREVGTVIHTGTATIVDDDGQRWFYWFEKPEGLREGEPLPPDVTLHGPFKTEAELKEHELLTLMGPDCKVTEGGAWDPAWDKLQ
jgi:hypothetical protein